MLNLYLVSVIISIMISTIVLFNRNRSSTTFDFICLFLVKLYFALIPLFNLLLSSIMLYILINDNIIIKEVKNEEEL